MKKLTYITIILASMFLMSCEKEPFITKCYEFKTYDYHLVQPTQIFDTIVQFTGTDEDAYYYLGSIKNKLNKRGIQSFTIINETTCN